jgi:hypothetical protein
MFKNLNRHSKLLDYLRALPQNNNNHIKKSILDDNIFVILNFKNNIKSFVYLFIHLFLITYYLLI